MNHFDEFDSKTVWKGLTIKNTSLHHHTMKLRSLDRQKDRRTDRHVCQNSSLDTYVLIAKKMLNNYICELSVHIHTWIVENTWRLMSWPMFPKKPGSWNLIKKTEGLTERRTDRYVCWNSSLDMYLQQEKYWIIRSANCLYSLMSVTSWSFSLDGS